MRGRFHYAVACLAAWLSSQAIAATHLATHDRPHVHHANGSTEYLDAALPAVDDEVDTRSLFAAIEEAAHGHSHGSSEEDHSERAASHHDASGAGHLAVPFLAQETAVLLDAIRSCVDRGVPRLESAVAEAVPSSATSRGPPVRV